MLNIYVGQMQEDGLLLIAKGMKDYATKKLIENYIRVEHGYKEAQIPFLASWRL